MSAIAGIYYADQRPEAGAAIRRMVEVLSHLGPDGKDVWSDGAVGLGHLMLHTTPESLHETQPLVDEQHGLVLTADARIDNRDDLIRMFRLAPRNGRPVTDGEIVLAAYRKWGTACPEHLLGDFAFALWDAAERRLFCARDPFGVRPFFYYHEPGHRFAFATQIKALFQLEGVPDTIDKLKVAEHLMVPVEEDVTRTYFKHIRALAPAHSLVIDDGGIRSQAYWQLDPEHEVRYATDEAYAERFQELFEEAVRVRLRSAFPVGAMLSGGMDSSSIVCQASEIMAARGDSAPLHTFSAVYDEVERSNERSYIEAVLDKYERLEPHFIRADLEDPLEMWEGLLDHYDEGCHAANIHVNWRLHQTAQESGVRVVLDGFDGDTTVSHGLGFFYQLREEGRWLKLIKEVKAFAEKNGEPWRPAVWSWIRGSLLVRLGVPHLLKLKRAVLQRKGTDHETNERQPVWRRALHASFYHDIEQKLEATRTKPTTERAKHYERLEQPILVEILELLSAVSGAHAVDVRYPFYDRRLVEYCLALPPEQKIRNGWSRFVLRTAMEGILPTTIQWRPGKTDLSLGFDYALRNSHRARLKRLSERNEDPVYAFVDYPFMQEAIRQYANGLIDGSKDEGLLVWKSLSLSLWLHHRNRKLALH